VARMATATRRRSCESAWNQADPRGLPIADLARVKATPLAACVAVLFGCDTGPPPPLRASIPKGRVELTSARTARDLAVATPTGDLEVVALFDAAMPTGVTVSKSGRIFVSFPRWGDDVPFTVAELKDKKPVAYPDADMNRTGFVSVQSVVVDPLDRLWVLDTGSIEMKPTDFGGPKLVAIDLATNKVQKTIVFPREVALATSYVNDVRFDLTRGKSGFAFVTDSSGSGPNGIIVVDLETGKSWRKLSDHPSTKADKSFVPIVEGSVLMQRGAGQPPKPFAVGADGIAISEDGKTLYYSPLSSRHLFAVSTDALANQTLADDAVARTVRDLGEKGASDGLESDAQGRVYCTEYEANAILRRRAEGTFETIAADPRLMWPDTLSLADDGYLYVVANQLERQARFHEGEDLRDRPYALFRVKVDGTRVALKR
jgi:sugar lactone lactonase YvrE